MFKNKKHIVVAGAGAFGTALASVLSHHTQDQITLLARSKEHAKNIADTRKNARRLPNIILPNTLNVTADYSIIKEADLLLSVVPSRNQADFIKTIQNDLTPGCPFIICAKGFDHTTGQLISTQLAQHNPKLNMSVLSGPGFACDLANGLPTAMTLAAPSLDTAETIANCLSRKTFRLYASDDMIGVQIGGALKNVLAIAAGIVMGAGLGESARASLLARGLSELSRYIEHKGGKAPTASGLSGLGDLILTATSEQSRNYSFGLKIGKGQSLEQLLGPNQPLVEGANAAIAAAQYAHDNKFTLPITQAVAAIISNEIDVQTAIEQLLARPLRSEIAF